MSDEEYTKAQYGALEYSNQQFDKNVLFIASGALGISFAFIEQIIPDMQNAICSKFLIRSWHFFAGVIFLSLVAHFISILANRWAIENDEQSCKNYNRKKFAWNWLIRSLNVIMILGLLAGIILLIKFVKLNIS